MKHLPIESTDSNVVLAQIGEWHRNDSNHGVMLTFKGAFGFQVLLDNGLLFQHEFEAEGKRHVHPSTYFRIFNYGGFSGDEGPYYWAGGQMIWDCEMKSQSPATEVLSVEAAPWGWEAHKLNYDKLVELFAENPGE